MPFIKEPHIIDIEASGFGNNSYPIEVGVAFGSGQKYCSLISPESHWTHWDNNAEEMHHISRKTLKENGKKSKEVAQQLNQLFRNQVLYTDGWVVDKPWLKTLFQNAHIDMQFEISPIELILSEAQMNIWHPVKDKIIAENAMIRHRASNDAWIIQTTYKKTLELSQNSDRIAS